MTTKKKAQKPAPGKPRTRREQDLVDYVLEHADEIKAARASCRDRAVEISPHHPPEARQAARLARHLRADPAGEVADALSDILIEVSNDSQVFWDNPEIARLLYDEASKLAGEYEDVRMRLGHLREVMDAAEAGKPLAPLMRSWGYTSNPRWREAARPQKGGAR